MAQLSPTAARSDGGQPWRLVAGLTWCLGALVWGGCATSAGERAFRDGHYPQAAEAFASELARNPGDRGLRERLETARLRAIEADLQRAQELREAGQGQAAVVLVGRTLLRAEEWEVTLSADGERRKALAVEATDRIVREQVKQLVADKSPLAARSQLDRYRPILMSKPLRLTMTVADQLIREGGRARCAELVAEGTQADAPYWHWVLERYCAALGSPQPKTLLPGLFKGLRVTIQTKDAAGVERQILEEWLAEWFKHSVWYAAEATDLLAARVENDFDATLEKRPATLHSKYRKRTTNTVVNEDDILARSHEYTVESNEDFVYAATLYIATYRLDAVITLDLGSGLAPFVAHLKADDSKRAYDHDVNFPPANIHPQRPHLLSAADWLKKYLDHEVKPLSRRLGDRWTRTHCGVTDRTLEGASRCLFGGQPSNQATSVIHKKLGNDGTLALALFGGPPPTEDQPAGEDDDEWNPAAAPGTGPQNRTKQPGGKSSGPTIESVPPASADTI